MCAYHCLCACDCVSDCVSDCVQLCVTLCVCVCVCALWLSVRAIGHQQDVADGSRAVSARCLQNLLEHRAAFLCTVPPLCTQYSWHSYIHAMHTNSTYKCCIYIVRGRYTIQPGEAPMPLLRTSSGAADRATIGMLSVTLRNTFNVKLEPNQKNAQLLIGSNGWT